MNALLADYAVSVTEMKRNYASIIGEAAGAVAVLNHNKPEAYLIPAQHYEQLMDYLEDLQDAITIRKRANETAVKVSPDEIGIDKLPDGSLNLHAEQATGSIDAFIGRHAGKVKQPISIDEMNEITSQSWAGE